ncbi:hypothetical protein CONPUDRAFT_61537, partial [Coniophora puteana RWD-64-598 SS2]
LQIHGFMRKFNLRNVDPVIDDPDAQQELFPRHRGYLPASREVLPSYPRSTLPPLTVPSDPPASLALLPPPTPRTLPIILGCSFTTTTPPSLSPDSRPTTGHSLSSVSSLPYEEAHHHGYHSMAHDDYSRPGSSHHLPRSFPSSAVVEQVCPLSIRRPRCHSQVMSPYSSPYDHSDHPSTSPHPIDDGSMPRVRSMIQLPSADYNFGGGVSQPEFAYSAGVGSAASIDSLDARGAWGQHHSVRPSTST